MTRWKWDVDRKDPLVNLRIPVTSITPLYSYIAVLDKDGKHRPTQAEALMLRSFIDEHADYWFTAQQREQNSKQPFDTELGRNAVVFHKYGADDWGYRRVHWQIGSMFTPPSPKVATRVLGPLPLLGVMDLIHDGDGGHAKHWRKWKAERPEVFGQ